MQKLFLILLTCFLLQTTFAQDSEIAGPGDSFMKIDNPSERAKVVRSSVSKYLWSNPDSALVYSREELLLASAAANDVDISVAYTDLSWCYVLIGDYTEALHSAQEGLKYAERSKSFVAIAYAYAMFPVVYEDEGDYERALYYNRVAFSIINKNWKPFFGKTNTRDTAGVYISVLQGLSSAHEKLNQLDSALYYMRILDQAYTQKNGKKWAPAYFGFGNIYLKKGETQAALDNFRNGANLSRAINNLKDEMDNSNGLARTYFSMGAYDSSLFYANRVLDISRVNRYSISQLAALNLIANNYKANHNNDSLAKYLQLTIAAKDSIFSQQKLMKLQSMTFNDQMRRQEMASKEREIASRNKMYALLAGLVLFLIAAVFLWRNNRQKQHAKRKIEAAYDELKLAQQEVEANNRELEIEGSLERVRTQAMAMRQASDMLGICKIISQQLELLHVKDIRNVQTALIHEEKGTYTNFEYYRLHDKLLITEVPYKGEHPVQAAFANQMLQGPEAFYNSKLEGDALKNWIEYQKHTPQFVDSFLEKANSLNYYWYSLGPVALGISTYDPLTEEQMALFRRFRNVFELSHRRYMDIEQARTQARAAEIELGLERVRARAMAMQNSEELKELIGTVFTELTKLDIVLTRCLIMIYDPETNDSIWWMANSEAPSDPLGLSVQFHEHPPYQAYVNAFREQKLKWTYTLEGEIKKNWDDFLFVKTGLSKLPDFVIAGMKAPDRVFLNASFNSFGNLTLATLEPLSEEHFDIMLRFAKVFDLTYTRFNDLKQAEAQAREAKIEMALEKVRSRTMAMQHSHELADVAQLLFQQVKDLGIKAWTTGFNIWNADNTAYTDWITGPGGEFLEPYTIDVTSHPTFRMIGEAKRRGEDFFVSYLEGEQIKETYEWLNKFGDKGQFQKILDSGVPFPSHQYNHFVFGGQVSLLFITYEPYPEAWDVFKRFGKVFEQTYTRFLDLQKAEAQTKEAQIELALERVRARTMAMHHSDELREIVALVFEKLQELNFLMEDRATGILLFTEGSKDHIQWIADPGHSYPAYFHNPYTEYSLSVELIRAKESGVDYFSKLFPFEEKNEFFKYLFEHSDYSRLPDDIKKLILGSKNYGYSVAFGKNSAILVPTNTGQLLSDNERDILKRFAKVFEQAYVRFSDLQKAEGQARESEIQLALERVRARTMAMHKTEELADTAQVLFQQISELGQIPDRVSICIPDETKGQVDFWVTDQAGTQIQTSFKTAINEPHVIAKMMTAWKASKKSMVVDLQGTALNEWIRYVKDEVHLPVNGDHIHVRRVHSAVFFSHGWIMNSSPEPSSPESLQTLERFASVFNLTYRRFLDLQKAEISAKEATVEAAMEKVRGKAMAMHNSNDLSATASMVFTELRKLGIDPIRCGVGLLREDTRKAQLYSATSSENGDSLALIGWVQLENHPVLEKIYDSWIANEEYYPVLAGEQLHSYYQKLLAGLSVSVPDTAEGIEQHGTFLPISVGCLYAWSQKPYNEEQIRVLKRFATIIDLTFRRYIELQQSETNARETVKQAALDRVRAEIASMRTTSDLERITPTIWNELTILGIPFIRCGVFIMNDAEQQVHTFLSTPDGKAIAAFHLPFNAPGDFSNVVTHWQHKERYVDHWDVKEFENLADVLVQQNAVASREAYLNTIPPEGMCLHFSPFLQGMLYVGNTTTLGDDDLRLVQSLADAFSTAYARYDDFTRLESAKDQIEKTLVDLRQAQQQLVQSEKMASLGELTAGIAHEIQNPLNFVNNFSDVSAELLNEMKTEIKKGNSDDAMAIATSVMENLGKILHHGKRADAIVKGMLQHSRTSSGVMELTDMNQLADEYLRLAYHGLRAKDKTFNASFKTDFDEKLPRVNIIPQDIGRVLVNMINNAFYAVSEKRKQNIPGYEPTVTISTRKLKGYIELRIADNGIGISQKVIDKIFQPFFTTKPTGQGTGLGLSLTYDIVKAHGGEISVQSNEGEGSTFVIQLPSEE